MLRLTTGEVATISNMQAGLYTCQVRLADGRLRRALAYGDLLPRPPAVGDRVIVNTTAADMGLGTGGCDFVVALLDVGAYGGAVARDETVLRRQGHLMKLRYTPLQRSVLSIEAPESPWHEMLKAASDAAGLVVIAAELHSQGVLALRLVQELAAGRPEPVRAAYVMPGGGALPAAFSKQLGAIRQAGGVFCGTITCGEAYGGDYEAVTAHSALIAARHALRADICVAAIGPGVVGTGTPFGTTALTQGDLLNAALDVEAAAVAVPRVSFADPRPRHSGISHHTITVLTRLVHRTVTVALPELRGEQAAQVESQLESAGVPGRHRVEYTGLECTRRVSLRQPGVTSMGRGYDDDPAFFEAVGAAVSAAWRLAGSRPE